MTSRSSTIFVRSSTNFIRSSKIFANVVFLPYLWSINQNKKTMKKTLIKLRELIRVIPEEVQGMYNISIKDKEILIHSPAFVNIYNPNTIEERECVYEIKSKKMVVTIWKKFPSLHICIF